MPLFPPPRSSSSGFTLTELLVVVAIMGCLAAVSVPAAQGLAGSGKFNQTVEGIASILEQARSYAVGQNTYVWVAFYPIDPATLPAPYTEQGGEQLYVVPYASTDGTDPVQWGSTLTSVPIPYAPAGTSPSIVQITKPRLFKQIHLETQNYFTSANIPSMPPSENSPAAPLSQVSFSLPLKSPSITLSSQSLPGGESSHTLIIGFTPSGSAQVSSSLVTSIGLDLQPMLAAGVKNTANLAALRISGLVGLTTVYRK